MKPVETLPPISFKFASSFILLTILAGLGVGVARVLTSLYAVHIEANELQLGLIAAAQSFGLLLMALPVGVLVQRFGSFRIFALGSVIAAVLYSLLTFYSNAWFLLVITALVSFALPMRFVSIHTVFLTHLKQLGAAKAGWFRGSHMMGFFLIAPALAVYFIEHVGYIGTFWMVALIFLSAIVLAPMCFDFHHQAEADQPRWSWKEVLQPLALIKTHPQLRTICSLEFMASMANNYFGFFIVVIAIQTFSFQEPEAVMLLTLQGLVFVASLFGLGALAEIVGYYKFYLLGLSLISIALLLIALSTEALLLWPSSVALGLGLGILHIANFMSFAKVGEQTSMNQISPLLAMVGPAGGLLGGLLGAAFGHYIGLQAIFLPISLAFMFFTFLILRSKKFQQFLEHDSSYISLQRQEP